jgi:hypothetical protein
MATPTAYPEHPDLPAQAPATAERHIGLLQRWRERTVERTRRVPVQWLRRAANRADQPHPIAPR